MDKRIDRVIKLLEHAKSAESLGSLEEASAFAAKAQALMNEMKLSMSDIEFAQLTKDPIEESVIQAGPQRRAWAERLARIVAEAHQCRTLISRGGFIWFVGRQTDREVAQHVFLILYRTCLELSITENRKARRKARREGNVSTARGFVPTFRRGFTDEILRRYRAEHAKMYETLSQRERGVAMIRLSGTDIVEYIQSKYKRKIRTARGRDTIFNDTAYSKGREAGSKVDIRSRGVGTGKEHKALGAG